MIQYVKFKCLTCENFNEWSKKNTLTVIFKSLAEVTRHIINSETTHEVVAFVDDTIREETTTNHS